MACNTKFILRGTPMELRMQSDTSGITLSMRTSALRQLLALQVKSCQSYSHMLISNRSCKACMPCSFPVTGKPQSGPSWHAPTDSRAHIATQQFWHHSVNVHINSTVAAGLPKHVQLML